MKDLLEISCGLDVHKEKLVACMLTGPLGEANRYELSDVTSLIPDMLYFRDGVAF